jgi:hypothetical protein
MGWLIELDMNGSLLETGRLDVMLSEMRLLGLQPTVLETVRSAAVSLPASP